MKKFSKLALAFLIIFLVIGCGSETKEEGDQNQTENEDQTQNEQRIVLPTSDVPGDDPLSVPRYPGSIRTYYMGGTFVRYFAEAEIEEIVDFYRDFANEIGFDFLHEINIGEEQEHWLHIENPNDSIYGYGVTLDLYENTEGYVDWILYAPEWPE